MLRSLITEENIQLAFEANHWREVVEKAGELLLNSENIEPRYIEAMKELITQEGPYMVVAPGIVLLHARPEDGALSECMSLVTVAKPIHFGHPENDPVDIAIAFAAQKNQHHIKMLSEIARLLQDEARLNRIRTTENPQDVIKALFE
jgi:mannitol/fructose-specific phosphotransferase system IIA component (Ntr-type)